MSDKTDLITSVFYAAKGEIIGRIRLQKIFYLLEQLGLGGEFRFSYHHFGPFSSDLSDSLDLATLFTINEDAIDSSFGGVYYKYSVDVSSDKNEKVGNLDYKQASSLIEKMKDETSVVIELAATIHWLQNIEEVVDWEKELKIRKHTKATDLRIKKAVKLLDSLDLSA